MDGDRGGRRRSELSTDLSSSAGWEANARGQSSSWVDTVSCFEPLGLPDWVPCAGTRCPWRRGPRKSVKLSPYLLSCLLHGLRGCAPSANKALSSSPSPSPLLTLPTPSSTAPPLKLLLPSIVEMYAEEGNEGCESGISSSISKWSVASLKSRLG